MIIRKIKPAKTLLILTLSLFFIFISPFKISGDEFSDYAKKLQDNIAQQAALQKQIDDSVKQERDLAGQIAYMDNQIKLTTLKIEETETTIERLGLDILSLTDRLGKLQGQLENLVTISNQRIRLIHEQTFVNPMAETLLNTRGIDDFIMRTQYLAHIRKNDIRVLEQLQSTKTNYNDQKDLLGQKKKQQEDLKAKSIAQKASLDNQKNAKDQLLKETKNSEANFRALLARLQADAESIRNALSNLGAAIGPVKKGQVIALEGSSGCSTGPHLHFEAFTNAKVVNGKVQGTRIDPQPLLDNGSLGPPYQGYPNVYITTKYGDVYYIFSSQGTMHTGIDMADDSKSGTPILAAADGIAYPASDTKPCSLTGTIGKGIVIDHGNGLVTLYWHIQ